MANRQEAGNSTAVPACNIENAQAAVDGKYSTRKPARKASKTPEMVKLTGRKSASESPSEAASGLRRVSFLLPEALAKEFDERGGAAWLALILSAEESIEVKQSTPLQAAATKLKTLPVKAPRDAPRIGRRRGSIQTT